MRISLIVTTYERPDALAAVLATVGTQERAPDEILVADDGSGAATRAVVDRFAAHCRAPVAYMRQEHAGFRVARLRNLAIAASRGDYLIFIDGDMLLHADFIGDHEAVARPRDFVQGMRIPLDDPDTQAALAAPALPACRATPRNTGGLRRLYGLRSPLLARACVKLANPVVALKSCNFALWRDDFVAVNGFNEDFVGWGPEDKEFAARLTHSGCSRRTLIFGGIAWHLHHPPASRDRRAANEALLAATLANRTIRCRRGLDAHPANTAAWL